MKKVLIVTKDLRLGNGVASCIMNYFLAFEPRDWHVDFLSLQYVESPYIEQVKQNNGSIYVIPKSKFKYSAKVKRYIEQVISKNKYDLIHVNLPGPYGAMILKYAKRYGVKRRIYHSHNPKNNLTLKSTITSSIYNRLCVGRATNYLACSELAGKSIFKEKEFYVLKNTIDAEKYRYDENCRESIRKKIGVENEFLLGVVGRIELQKNPLFVMECFYELKKINHTARLVWVGEGCLLRKVEEYVYEKQLENSVHFVGTQSNVAAWYSAMDAFLLPSKFEGLGIVYIEAQASGLPCYASNKVPQDTAVTNNIKYIELSRPAKEWAEIIATNIITNNRHDSYKNIIANGYDLVSEKSKLLNYYETILE